MKYAMRLAEIPDGAEPKPNMTVTARRIDTGVTLGSGVTDANGLVSFEADGHWPPFYLHISGIPGGDKFWRSDEHHGAGALALAEIPLALRSLSDGVVRGHLNGLAPTLNSLIVSLATGTALVAGYPVVNTTADQFTLVRPVTSTRVDRLVARVYPLGSGTTPGLAEFAVLAGTEGAGTPALTQSATVHEVSLATVTVPTAGTLTLVDDRLFAGEMEPESSAVQVSSFTTTDASGVLITGSTITLDIPRSGTYDVAATLTAQQTDSQIVTAWALQDTYGSTGSGVTNLDTPAQVASLASGVVLIADTGNASLKFLSGGVIQLGVSGLTGITGVCRDATGDIYVAYGTTLRKYSADLTAILWTVTVGTALKHVATDSTHVYVVDSGGNKVWKRLCSTGAAVTSWGTAGSGDGQFNSPQGIAYSSTDTLLYVADSLNTRIQVFTTLGTFQRKWTVGSSLRGVAIDATGRVFVAYLDAGTVNRYTALGVFVDSFAQSGCWGVAVTTGDVVWVGNVDADTITKWDEASTPGGYGQVAIEIDSVVGTYSGSGNRDSAVAAVNSGTKTGGGTVVVRGFAKATAATLTLRGIVLSARAVPRA